MKKLTITFVFLFCLQLCLAWSTEKDLYLLNIEKALEGFQFDKNFETLTNPNLREEVKELFLQIYENEKGHPDFIQCITAQDSLFYAYQVIAKELYCKLYGMPRDDFEFLRFPTQNLIKTREEFLTRYPSFIISKEELAKELKTTPEGLDEALKAYERRDEEEYLRISRGEEETHNELDDDNECEEEVSSRFSLNLETAVQDDEVMQDFELESLSLGVDHSQKAKATPIESDYSSKDCVNLSSSTAISRLNDTDPKISKELISVNFTMETYRPLDSALFVFLSGYSVSLSSLSDDDEEYKQKLFRILYELFDSLSLPKEKLTECLEKLIEQAPRSKFGIINQIFIPKENIDNSLYLSFGGGFLHSIYDSKFEESYIEFQNNRQSESFRTFRNFQARVIAGSLLENPEVKILRYTLIPKEAQSQYEAIVRDAIDKLLTLQEIEF